MNNKRSRYIIDVIFITIQLICIIGLFTYGSYDYMRMAIDNLIFWIIYMIFEAKFKWNIPLYVRITAVVAISSNDFLGEYLNLYVTSFIYDRFQHVFGTYAMTLWGYFIIQQIIKVKFTEKTFIGIFIITLSVAFGGFYELLEFLEDKLYDPVIKNQPSLLDTDLDLLSDLTGGVIASIHYIVSKRLKSFQLFFEKTGNQKKI
ncbi:hypothetical protein AB9M62_01725 [Bacillales bacterium AN1005]